MNVILGILVVLINTFVLLKNSGKGLVLFCILMVTCPVIRIAEVAISYVYAFIPILTLWSLSKGLKTTVNRFIIPFYYIVLLTIISSCLCIFSKPSNASANYFEIVGIIKFIFLLSILSNDECIKENFNSIIRTVIFINCFAMTIEFIALSFTSDEVVIKEILKLYGTLGSSASFQYILSINQGLGRLPGTFPSTAFPATLSVLGVGLFLHEYMQSKQTINMVAFLGSLYIGILSSSKRFYLGAVLIIVFVALTGKNAKNDVRAHFSAKTSLFIMLIIAAMYAIYSFFIDSLNIRWYMNFLLQGKFVESMETRFGNEGIVRSMLPIIKNYPVFGVGIFDYPGIKITDSQLFVTLYRTGIIGLIAFIAFFLGLLRHIMRYKDKSKMIILLIVMFEFIISTEFYSHLGILFLSSIIPRVGTKNWMS